MSMGMQRPLAWAGMGVGTIGMAVLLSACGGDSGSGSSNDTDGDNNGTTASAELQGTAAIGQAIVNATLTATCQDGSGFTTSPVATDSHGKWQGKVASDQLPCLLKLSGGTPAIELTSMAFSKGTTNISPLTQAALVLATHDTEFDWTADKSQWPDQTEVDTAAQSLLNTLKSKGYAASTLTGSPFSTAFAADGTGWDAALDAIRDLVEDPASSIAGYDELMQLLADGNLNSLPDYSGGNNPNPVNPVNPPTTSGAVDKADLGNNSDPTTSEFLTLMSANSWPVAIYEVPASNPQWYGTGSLTIGGTDTNWTMELRGADGSVISSLTAQGAFTSALTAFSSTDLGVTTIYAPGHLFINKGTAITEFQNTYVEWDSGLIEGSAGGGGEGKFRNSLLAYGASVPKALSDLAGTWSATTNVYCNGPYGAPTAATNTVTITAAGQITMDGKTQLCGGTLPQTVVWGGDDDFLIPGPQASDGAYLMHIDAQDTVNVSAGTLQIRFDENMDVISFQGWIAGELLELRNPVKQ